MVAKVEIVWPHGGADAAHARLANITAYIFWDLALNPPPCDWDPTVRLWVAVNNEPMRFVKLGQRRLFTDRGITFPVWDFNDVDVSAANDPRNKIHFTVTVDDMPALHNVWTHGSDARTFFPQIDVPTGYTTGIPTALDAKIEIVWPHGGLPVERAQLANITVMLFERGTLKVVPAWWEWRPQMHLFIARNAEPGFPAEIVSVPREMEDNGLHYLVWDFNNVDVSVANDPANKLYFWVEVDGVDTNSNVWVHGADARTIFPVVDLPARSCQ